MPAVLNIQREDKPGSVTFHLEGTFNGETAALLRRSLDEVDVGEVVLDFTRVRDFVDAAVAVLTRGLPQRNVHLRGLGLHQERMFRYFGIATARAADRAYYKAEELLAG